MATDTTANFSGLSEAPAHLAFDENSLEAFMASEVDGFKGPLSVKKFKGGQSNPTYLISASSGKYVLRRKPPGKLLPSAHAVDREYRVMTALAAVGFPVPKTYALCEDARIIGTPFFIMDYVEGRIFWDSSLPNTDKTERRPLYYSLIDTIAELHRTDYNEIGLANYGKPGNYFQRQIARWSTQYKAAETKSVKEMDALIDWLPTAIPKDDASSIVHGDYRFDNVIMHPSNSGVSAVLDWELSTLGHPLADFTYFLMVWHFPPSVRGGLAGLEIEELGIPSLDEAVARYCQKTDISEIPNLEFCLSYNMFRLCSIAQGVYARALQGNASSPQAVEIEKSIKPLAALAWRYAQKSGAP